MQVWQGTPIAENNRPGWHLQDRPGAISIENVKVETAVTIHDGTPLSRVLATGICVPYVDPTPAAPEDPPTHEFAGILWGTVTPAGAGQTRGAAVTARIAEIVGDRIAWPADAGDKAALEAELKAAFLIVR